MDEKLRQKVFFILILLVSSVFSTNIKTVKTGDYSFLVEDTDGTPMFERGIINKIDKKTNNMLDCGKADGLFTCEYNILITSKTDTLPLHISDFTGKTKGTGATIDSIFYYEKKNITKTRPIYEGRKKTLENGTTTIEEVQVGTETYYEMEDVKNTLPKTLGKGEKITITIRFKKTDSRTTVDIYDNMMGIDFKEAAYWNGSYIEAHNLTFSSGGEYADRSGAKITTKGTSMVLAIVNTKNYTVAGKNPPTKIYLQDSALNILSTKTATCADSYGCTATFDYTLEPYTVYYIQADREGAVFYERQSTGGLPVSDDFINWTGGMYAGSDYSSCYQIWNLSLRNLTVADPLPNITAAFVYPNITTGQGMSLNITANGTSGFYNITYEWYLNGANTTGGGTYLNAANNTNTNISEHYGAWKGQNWSCKVRADNGTNYSSWSYCANITISNAAPIIISAVVLPATPDNNTNITCAVNATDLDDNMTVQGGWFVNGYNNTNYTFNYSLLINNTQATVYTINASNLTIGQNWSCWARVNDSTNFSTLNISSNVSIANGSLPVQIAWSDIMTPSDVLIPADHLHVYYISNYSTDFINYTCFLNYTNGSLVSVISTTTNTTLNQTFTSITPYYTYYVSCTIYSTSGQASTTVREYTFLGNILTGGDFLAFGVMIGLALMTFIFSFIASNSKTEGWTKVWIMFTLFFSCMTMLSIAYFSEQDGETAILEITMWIFYILLMLFMIMTLIFLYSSVIGFLLKAFEMMTTRRWKH